MEAKVHLETRDFLKSKFFELAATGTSGDCNTVCILYVIRTLPARMKRQRKSYAMLLVDEIARYVKLSARIEEPPNEVINRSFSHSNDKYRLIRERKIIKNKRISRVNHQADVTKLHAVLIVKNLVVPPGKVLSAVLDVPSQ